MHFAMQQQASIRNFPSTLYMKKSLWQPSCLTACTPAPKIKQKKNKHNVLIVFISSSQPVLKLLYRLELFQLLYTCLSSFVSNIQYDDLFAITIYCVFVYFMELHCESQQQLFWLRDVRYYWTVFLSYVQQTMLFTAVLLTPAIN